MADDTNMEQRVADLETHIAHQQSTIDDLSDVTARQWETIDRLVREVDRLKDRLGNLEEDNRTGGRVDAPPPHY